MIKIDYRIKRNNFKIKILDKLEYSIEYPKGILENLSEETKKSLADNFIYSRTAPLASLSNDTLIYHTDKPLLKNFIDYGVIKDLPRFSFLVKKDIKDLLKNFQKTKRIFKDIRPAKRCLPDKKTSSKKAILSMSFGKDSLLSYALAKEIGLKLRLVFTTDMEKYNPGEFRIKKRIIKSFLKEQKEDVLLLRDDTDNIFRNKIIMKNISELDGTNAILAFALEFLPLAYDHLAKYIIFGNEKNLDDFFIDKNGYKVYPSYDQSSIYMNKENLYFKKLTNDNIQVISLVKPLYNIAEIKILYNRYPKLLKYLMSCCSKKLKNERWCYDCPDCTKLYLYAAATGNPRKLGMVKNMFEEKYKKYYPLFTSKIKRIYERPRQVREEQLLAFLLAYRNGFKGKLIDLFKKRYLNEAQKREKELRRKFFGINKITLIPKELKNKVLKIYHEELKDLI